MEFRQAAESYCLVGICLLFVHHILNIANVPRFGTYASFYTIVNVYLH